LIFKTVTCIKILNSGNPELDGGFFDVVLKQRGKSLNYEVVFGELEDPEVCQPPENGEPPEDGQPQQN
jgi:hypothetical protein